MTLQPLFLLAGLIFLSACATSSKPSEPNGLPDTGKPALHAVSDAKLHELMDRMNSLMFERFIVEPELDRERRRYAGKMAENADALAATVDGILDRLPALNLDPHEQTTFRALATKLRDEAANLKTQAQLNHIDAIEETLKRTSSTCSSCHALFRNLGH